jgi:hypothetical protein
MAEGPPRKFSSRGFSVGRIQGGGCRLLEPLQPAAIKRLSKIRETARTSVSFCFVTA